MIKKVFGGYWKTMNHMLSLLVEWVEEPNNRPKVLLSTVAIAITITVALEALMRQTWMSWFRALIEQSAFLGDVFFPADKPAWKDKLTALIPIIGLPVAFWLWHWRDKNVRDQITEQRNQVENQKQEVANQSEQINVQKRQIHNQGQEISIQRKQLEYQGSQLENQRKELLLREFQDVQRQAAGLFEINGSNSAKIQLQISALHQLREFLSDRFPTTFRRAAFELLMAGHADSMRRIEVSNIDESDNIYMHIKNCRSGLDPISQERIAIIQSDIPSLVGNEFPISGRRLDLLNFSDQNFSSGINFKKCSVIGCSFYGVKLVDSQFWDSDLRGAELWHGRYESCSFWDANLIQADLTYSKFFNSEFRYTNLQGADLEKSIFRNCQIFDPKIDSLTNLKGVKLDEKCSFNEDWEEISDQDIHDRKDAWLQKGATFN